LEQLKEIIADENMTNQGASKIQEQVEDGEEVLDAENTSSGMCTVLNRIMTNMNPSALMRKSGC
jgi:hypothetical protein